MAAADDLKKAQDKLADPNFRGTYEFEGKKYSRTELRDVLIPILEKRATAAAKRKKETEAGFTSLRAQISAQEKLVKDLESALFADRRAFRKNNLSEAELAASEKRLDDAKKRLAQLTTREPVPTRRPTTSTTTKSGVGEQRTGAPDVVAETAGFKKAFGGGVDDIVVTGGTGGTGAAAPKKVTRANVTAELTKRGLADTPENRATVRAELEGKTAAAAQDWEKLVAEQAGEYAYLLDPKYEGVPELLRKAVQQGYFKSEEGQKQFLQEFQATGYYRNTSQKQQLFDKKTPADKRVAVELEIDKIRSEYGEIQFDQAALEEVATAAARNGATAVELGRLVYRTAFKIGAAQPVFGASTAAKTALGGEDVARVRAIYRAYGQKADDQQIARILAGEIEPASGVVMTEDMLRNNLRDIAKVSYAPFADLLDRGISVETIFQPYKNLAASVLEKNPEQIEMFQPNGKLSDFASALMGEKPMSLVDWMTELKSKEKYGWQFTNEAKQKATSLVMDLEKAFGFRA
jgi:hypothetical protein